MKYKLWIDNVVAASATDILSWYPLVIPIPRKRESLLRLTAL